MDIIIIIVLLLTILLSFASFFIALSSSLKNRKNKVHFYVARDKNGTMWLFFNKPIRVDRINIWAGYKRGFRICADYHFESVGLNKDDYKDLKWEDKPLEVFLNLED